MVTTRLQVCPTPPKSRAPAAALRREPSGRLRQAVLLMVWQGIDRDEAAKRVGMLPKSVYNSFRKHHVRMFYNTELRALRESTRAKVFHRLEALAMQDGNQAAAVKACQVLLADESERERAAAATPMPGLIVIVENAARLQPTKVIEHEPQRDRNEGGDAA